MFNFLPKYRWFLLYFASFYEEESTCIECCQSTHKSNTRFSYQNVTKCLISLYGGLHKVLGFWRQQTSGWLIFLNFLNSCPAGITAWLLAVSNRNCCYYRSQCVQAPYVHSIITREGTWISKIIARAKVDTRAVLLKQSTGFLSYVCNRKFAAQMSAFS